MWCHVPCLSKVVGPHPPQPLARPEVPPPWQETSSGSDLKKRKAKLNPASQNLASKKAKSASSSSAAPAAMVQAESSQPLPLNRVSTRQKNLREEESPAAPSSRAAPAVLVEAQRSEPLHLGRMSTRQEFLRDEGQGRRNLGAFQSFIDRQMKLRTFGVGFQSRNIDNVDTQPFGLDAITASKATPQP